MLCVNLLKYLAQCGTTVGGVSRAWVFDPDDFNFTSGATLANGAPSGYSAVALRGGATEDGGGLMFPFSFEENTGAYSFENPVTESGSTRFTHTLVGTINNISQGLNNYLNSLNSAATCCGLGVIVELNTGVILVMGEKYVDSQAIRRFKIKASSTGTSGSTYEDGNNAVITFAGDYFRALHTFTGGVQSIIDLEGSEDSSV